MLHCIRIKYHLLERCIDMKKLLAVLLSVLLMFTLSFGICVYADKVDDSEVDAGDIFGETTVYFENTTVVKGSDVTVDLMLNNNPGVTEVKIAFELPQGITLKGVTNGNAGTASLNGNVVTVVNQEGVDDGCIAKVTFTATGEGEKTVKLSATAKNGEQNINISGSEGVINVTAPAVVVVLGDVDGDGDADTTDLAIMKLILVDLEDKETAAAGADIDGDGDITTTDLAKLKLILVAI